MSSRMVLVWITICTLATTWVTAQEEPVNRVWYREDRTFLVNGEPFFPIGLYYAEESIADQSGEKLVELRRMGFNTIFFNGNVTDLDRIYAAGLRVWFRPPGEFYRDYENLERTVEAARNHPALLFWEMVDEPVYNRINIEDVRKGYEIVKRVDPNHPVLCVQAVHLHRAVELVQWGALSDVYGFDWYPVKPNEFGVRTPRSIATMGCITDFFQSVVPGKPIIAVCQAWSWSPARHGKAGYPTLQEGRFMPYQCIVHGAKGIFFYGVVHLTKPKTAVCIPEDLSGDPVQVEKEFREGLELNAWFWSYFKDVVAELSRMTPVFTAPQAEWQPSVNIVRPSAAAPSAVRLVVKQYGDVPVIIMVNETPVPLDVEITAQTFARRRIYSWFRKESPNADRHGAFRDRLEAYDVRIYAPAPETLLGQ